MLKLASNEAVFSHSWSINGRCIRLSANKDLPKALRATVILIIRSSEEPTIEGFLGYLFVGHNRDGYTNAVSVSDEFAYLGNDDVLFIDKAKSYLRSLFRANSGHNSFLITERCNHYCVMCSQPPREIDDGYLVSVILEAIHLLPYYTRCILITGGEPTLLGEGLLEIIRACKVHIPFAGIHILSNGTNFKDNSFAARVAAIAHPDLMFGIPIYSHIPERHNFVVQAQNAWDSTIHGILNLKGNGVKVEIRVVLHKFTIPTLDSLADFLATNLLFIDQVAFMGLEATGFARSNWDDLWIHPKEYQKELHAAVSTCSQRGIRTMVYNLPLCWLDSRLHSYAVQSISDWKNDYPSECSTCAAFSRCGGFFSSNLEKGATLRLQPFDALTWSSLR